MKQNAKSFPILPNVELLSVAHIYLYNYSLKSQPFCSTKYSLYRLIKSSINLGDCLPEQL